MKRISVIALALIFSCALVLTGCGKETEETIYGEISSINGGTISLNLGNMQERGQNDQGSMPQNSSAPNPDTQTTNTDTKTTNTNIETTNTDTMTTGNAATQSTVANDKGSPPSVGNPPTAYGSSGENAPPNMDGKGPNILELTGEQRTITVPDATTVQSRRGEEVSDLALSDLAVGDIIEVVIKKNTVISVSLISKGKMAE